MGEHVWVKSGTGDFDAPIGARILSKDGKKAKILDDDRKERTVPVGDILRPIHVNCIWGVDDMITLGELHEHGILRNLYMRYKDDVIYTYTGTMLVAVNPYHVLHIYSNQEMSRYRKKKIGELPPHIFAIGDSSYEDMFEKKEKQCIVISGESGAGKTESTKLILQYLSGIHQKHSWIEQQILDANPVLEAFGNAKTVRNDNSSRFGKYIEIYFTDEGVIQGAQIKQYLLEKSRIVGQSTDERNYHIFYSMLEGMSAAEKQKLALSEASSYKYLIGGKTVKCEDRNESSEFSNIKSAMKVLNFSDDSINNIFQILAAILHLGNVAYKSVTVANMDTAEIADVKSLEKIANILGTSVPSLQNALIKKTIVAQGDSIVTKLTPDQAYQARDAFVKSIYGQLFIHLVDKINTVVHTGNPLKNSSIGVLDIFGFENFDVNSFEQLCINYANERLQQFFVKHIFKIEQEEYTKEGINWNTIVFVDNQEVLDVLSLKSMSIFSIIDEETKFPKGTDLTMLDKLIANHGQAQYFYRPKFNNLAAFGVNHFAGPVCYNVTDFLEKNRDTFNVDFKQLIRESKFSFFKDLFPDVSSDTGKASHTLSGQFQKSLDKLMGELEQCHPYFIRCIKPNDFKKPKLFDRALCCRQLRYSGMMETAKIRQLGYPIRHDVKTFVDRYRILAPGVLPSHKANCKEASKKICQHAFGDTKGWQIGYTKVFLKDSSYLQLEQKRYAMLARYIIVIQARTRGWLCRKRYVALKKATLVLQTHWRARGPRKRFLALKRGYTRLQAKLRSRQLQQTFKLVRFRITKFQAYCKGFVVRKSYNQKKAARKAKLAELLALRKQEEIDFKKAGMKDYKAKAEANFRQRLAEFDLLYREEEVANYLALDEEEEIDNVFGFLDEAHGAFSKRQSQGVDYIGLSVEAFDIVEDVTLYNFRKFAVTYFVGNVNHQYYRKPLRRSLLELPLSADQPAAKALWVMILRFMGDLPEPRFTNESKDTTPVMSKLSSTISRNFVKSKDFQLAMSGLETEAERNERRKLISMTLKRQTKLNNIVSEDGYDTWLENRTSNLEKLHFIIGHGIIRPELRDEILCQICKQLTNNPSKASYARGWVLLCLCIGCFSPSDLFLPYLRAFIQIGPKGLSPYCLTRLNRTFKNGPRSQPPSWLELQAIKSKKPIELKISLMDGSLKIIEADAATTASELCQVLSQRINLKNVFGFAIFIAMFDKVSSLSSGGDHIMDAISQCEQYSRERGGNEKSAPWRLFFRKEIFAPWEIIKDDSVAANLIYQQVTRGLKHGEYRCEKEGDLLKLAAQQYHVDHGVLDEKSMNQNLTSYIPDHLLKSVDQEKVNKWRHLFPDIYKKSQFPADKLKVKEDVVLTAMTKWSLMFSRFFEVSDMSESSGFPKGILIIAVNWTGLYVVDDREQVLLELPYMEISNIGKMENNIVFKLGTIDGLQMMFNCPTAKDLYDLVDTILTNLKKNSKYCVAVQNYHAADNTTFMEVAKGDLIHLSENYTGETVQMNGYGEGLNERNGNRGLFPIDCVTIVATVSKPSPEMVNKLKESKSTAPQGPSYGTIKRMKLYTLEKYAAEHFRTSAKKATVRGTITSIKEQVTEDLWRHSREPLRQPLLKKLQKNEQLSILACNAFTALLKYMGDQPSRRSGVEYTDKIFECAIQHDILKDEIYCHIMKQLTVNRNKISEERGWELLWLVTGLFTCSQTLATELTRFIQSRKHYPLAADCLRRYQKTIAYGNRKYPPHQVEVEAIQHKSLTIYHKVYFPDNTDISFEVESCTTAKALCHTIAERLDLKSEEGFSLFIQVTNKILSVPSDNFFFDYVRLLTNWIKKNMPSGGGNKLQYNVRFLKKLWVNTIPGRDPVADLTFYYPQEVQKYLRGFHIVSKPVAVKLAGVLYKIDHGDTKQELKKLVDLLPDLLPQDIFKTQKPKVWEKSVLSEIKKTKVSGNPARIAFLKELYDLPTFGSAFFEVKQTSEASYPPTVIIAISKKGVSVIHPTNKIVLASYEFSQISNWSSGNTYFHMTVGTMLRGGGTKLLMETQRGYEMDDLLASYVKFLKTQQNVKKRSTRSSTNSQRPPVEDNVSEPEDFTTQL